MKELELVKAKTEQLILQIDNLGQKGKSIKFQMQKIAYQNIIKIIEQVKQQNHGTEI